MKDVLVFTPYLRLEPETVKAIFSLEWDGEISVLFQRDNPFCEGSEREQEIRNNHHQCVRGREIFLAGSYEAMLIIESDIIPPADALKCLAALECDVAYGCYMFRRGANVINIYERYAPWPEVKNVGESLTIRGKWGPAHRQGVIECAGGGIGCILIWRNVLEKIQFRINYPEDQDMCDTFFTYDVNRAGFRMLADTRVICGHKEPNGNILWPPER